MMTTVYRVRMQDQSLPGFADGTINYYGSEQDIITLIQGLEGSQEMLAAAQEYFSGRGQGAARIWYEEPAPFIDKVEVIGTAPYERANTKFKFIHTGDYATNMKIEHLKADLLYIKDTDGKYKRCIKATVMNTTYQIISYRESEVGERITKQVGNDGWSMQGLPGFIKLETIEGAILLTNTLYYVDTIFRNESSIRKDMKTPRRIDLRQFFFGIYGNM